MTLLNREELLDKLEAERKECRLENERDGFERAYNIAECMATEPDVELVRHGKWNDVSVGLFENEELNKGFECSLCGAGWFNVNGFNYCPHCGAKMDKK